jgi:hypothetical protein
MITEGIHLIEIIIIIMSLINITILMNILNIQRGKEKKKEI